MNVDGKPMRTIWVEPDGWTVSVIDQTRLPHVFKTVRLKSLAEAVYAIKSMIVRGAPLIGATAAYGVALAMREDGTDAGLARAYERLIEARPTAINLKWALDEMKTALAGIAPTPRIAAAYRRAAQIADEDVAINTAIAGHGAKLIQAAFAKKKPDERVNVLTHCNAGWLSSVDVGPATGPIYLAHDAGIPVHVFVDETRPRNQGASLTAWELGRH